MTNVVATNSFELKQANDEIIKYCKGQLEIWRAQAEETSEIVASMQVEEKMDLSTVKNKLRAEQRRCVYYEKIVSALKKGHTILPDAFRKETIAVRTDQTTPGKQVSTWKSDLGMGSKRLPEGQGDYISPQVMIQSFKEDDKKYWKAVEIIEEISLPRTLIKSPLIGALKNALEDKIFDEIFVANSGSDPMLVGVVRGEAYKEVHFLIAWWVDFATI